MDYRSFCQICYLASIILNDWITSWTKQSAWEFWMSFTWLFHDCWITVLSDNWKDKGEKSVGCHSMNVIAFKFVKKKWESECKVQQTDQSSWLWGPSHWANTQHSAIKVTAMNNSCLKEVEGGGMFPLTFKVKFTLTRVWNPTSG